MSGGSHYLNPDGGRWCGDCGYVIGGNTWNARCEPDAPCWCCLAAEVEALRAQVTELKQQAHLSVSHALAEERAEKAEAQVAAVRQVRDEWERIGQAFAVYAARLDLSRDGAIRDIDRALDGPQ